MANTKVAFAENVVTVHVKRTSEPGLLPDGTEGWDVVSKNLSPGEYIPLSDIPPYLSDAVKEGKVPGLKIMTPAQAKRQAHFIETGYNPDIEELEEESDSTVEKE